MLESLAWGSLLGWLSSLTAASAALLESTNANPLRLERQGAGAVVLVLALALALEMQVWTLVQGMVNDRQWVRTL